MAKTSIQGQHRNRKLAERHRRELERLFGGQWEITSRRNSNGEYSQRGQTFTFEPVEEQPPPEPVYDWLVSFTYEPSGRSFDVLVTARDEVEAYDVSKQFLRADADAQRIVRAQFRNWQIAIARGRRTKLAPGEAEYRSESKE